LDAAKIKALKGEFSGGDCSAVLDRMDAQMKSSPHDYGFIAIKVAKGCENWGYSLYHE
jgi:hypothetical protein